MLATPGHSDDSVSFVLDDAVLTADTILGRGTTVIAQDGGGLGDYLESLKRLEGLGKRTVLPGHGPELSDLSAASAEYLAHREQRLDQVRAALAADWCPYSPPPRISMAAPYSECFPVQPLSRLCTRCIVPLRLGRWAWCHRLRRSVRWYRCCGAP
ncbi:beta-lactamase-like hydrolase [Mycobacteroides abscessus subsp. abscessus]|nr:beta-lactamase-like hydrolase [Mycobacteroides abscessus subsp. abscessus]